MQEFCREYLTQLGSNEFRNTYLPISIQVVSTNEQFPIINLIHLRICIVNFNNIKVAQTS